MNKLKNTLYVSVPTLTFGLGLLTNLELKIDTPKETGINSICCEAYNTFLEQFPNYYPGAGYEGFDTKWAIADIDSFYKLGKEYDAIRNKEKK